MASSTIRNNLKRFYQPVSMPGGWFFNHANTLKTSELYYNSKYHTGNEDDQGYYKFFFNITKPACDIATKFIDLDTKDIIALPLHSGNEFTVFVLQEDLKQYMRDAEFPSLLNEIAQNLPKYGSIVLKRTKDNKWHDVSLHNLRFDPSTDKLEHSDFVYELHPMTKLEIDKMPWDQKAVQKLYGRGMENTYVIYECYEPTVTGAWKKTIRADVCTKKAGTAIVRATEAVINDGENEFLPELVLHSATVSELPYRELHWERVPGRWLGYGFPEYLEDNQIAVNESEYLERKAMYIKALQIWQTADDSIGGKNALTQMKFGQILHTSEGITPVQKDYGDLSAYNNSNNKWNSNTERKTFTTDITTGANLPSRTPLGVANLQASLATSYFELKRENFGIFIRNLIIKDILPSFKDKRYRAHKVMFNTRDSIERVRKAEEEGVLAQAIISEANKTGFIPSPLALEDLRLRLKQRRSKERNAYVEVPDGIYDNVQYTIDVITTGEQVDVGQKSQVYTLALQIIGSNPAILQNPVTRNVFFKLMELGGISAAEFANMDLEQPTTPNAEAPMPQGGSVAMPQATSPMMMQQAQMV